MKMREVTVHNWRSICDLKVSSEDLMIFIGQNNHGKSNILSAILFFFGEIGLDGLDFHRTTDELFVEILFGELDENDRITFKKYVTSKNNMRVRKKATKGGGFSYHGYVEASQEDWLKEENIAQYSKREDAQALPLAYLLPATGRITKDAFRRAQEQFIQQHRNDLALSCEMESGPFLGAKNVAKGIFGEVYYVPSVKKAEDDLSAKGRSVFSALYARVINKMSETNREFQEAKQRIASLMRILNKTNEDGTENKERPPELRSFEESLEAELAHWSTKIDVEIIPPEIDDIFRVGATVWVDDGIRTDVGRKGQGLQRALIFALVRSLAKLTRLEREISKKSDGQDAEALSRQASKSSYFVLEEPELYLHPQAQRELFDSLVDLSKAESQVLLCTHSSSFISLDRYRSICIVRKNTIEEGTTIFQCTEDLFAEASDKALFNLTYWINPDRGELFFARKVVLTEGPSEKTVIPLLAGKLGIFRHDFTVVDCGSKNSIPSYLQLLNKFRIPYVTVCDRDHQAGKSAEAIASADKASARIQNYVDAAIGRTLILENDIEEELGIIEPGNKNKPYLAVAYVQAETFVFPDSLRDKVASIYSQM